MKLRLKYLLYFTFAWGECALGQNVLEARIDGQPLVYLEQGKTNGCGLRMFGATPEAVGSAWRWFDVSINLYRSGQAIVKGLSYDVLSVDAKSGRLVTRNVQVDEVWVKATGETATVPIAGSVLPADDKGGIFYATDDDVVFKLFMTAAKSEQMFVGVRRKGEKTTRLYAGEVALADSDRQRLLACLSELTKGK